ncbi:hypothetical protein JN531_012780 [Flagellatimonas centrodinii]|uniref:hypothetical protein n=1 Tax=Flagellatimonas centrodinii TaxID=2806210 RepID=UPI001FED7635|nr:hypothetical protein [Flagellatimonas centrodinii]ULQ45975.1 hypothetical protein JN531_012780 [Flagellatimonas centrodinii]
MLLNPHYKTLCAPNLVYRSTLDVAAPGDWDEAAPLANLQVPQFSVFARSDGLDDVNILGVIDRTRRVGAIALSQHNMTTAAQWRVRLYSDDAHAEEVYDSGLIDVWPAIYSSLDLAWTDPNFWSGKMLEEDRALYPSKSVHICAGGNIFARSFRIDIVDDDNADGAIDLGGLLLAEAWQPGWNASFGDSRGLIVNTRVARAGGGTKYYDVQQAEREVAFDYAHLSESEKNRMNRLRVELGIHGELLYLPNLLPGVTQYLEGFVGTFKQVDAITHPYLNNYATSVAIVEKI